MPKSKTYFPQVPVEFAKRVAKAESNGHATEALKRPTKKGTNGYGLAELTPDEEEREEL